MHAIDIIDDFLCETLLSSAKSAIADSKWEYGGTSTKDGVRFWLCELESSTSFIQSVLDSIEKRYNAKFTINRVYANGQTYGQDGRFHQDDIRPNTYTLLIYISNITMDNVDEVGGLTQIKNNGKIINIEPYVKRAVMFDSRLFHRGLAPSRRSDILRQTIAFKLSKSDKIEYI